MLADSQRGYAKSIEELTTVINSLREEIKRKRSFACNKEENLPVSNSVTEPMDSARSETKTLPETLSLHEERAAHPQGSFNDSDYPALKKNDPKEYASFWWIRKMSFDRNIVLAWSSLEAFKKKNELVDNKLDLYFSAL